LCEACWTSGSGKGWYKGDLTKAQLDVAPGSPLTAAVDERWLKVYYKRANTNELWVAAVATNETGWITNLVIKFA
jgi:hypothetical protein